MRTHEGGNLGKALGAWWRNATRWVAPQRRNGPSPTQKLPLIEDVVARAGREPPDVD